MLEKTPDQDRSYSSLLYAEHDLMSLNPDRHRAGSERIKSMVEDTVQVCNYATGMGRPRGRLGFPWPYEPPIL